MSNTDETLSIRSPEDVNTAANIAGIVPANIPIQLLHFTTLSDSEDIRLLQMTNEMIESLKSGQRYVCTPRQTSCTPCQTSYTRRHTNCNDVMYMECIHCLCSSSVQEVVI